MVPVHVHSIVKMCYSIPYGYKIRSPGPESHSLIYARGDEG